MKEEDCTDKFIESQGRLGELLKRAPVGIQNWSYQKTAGFKKAAKKCEAILRLKPSSKQVDYLKVDNELRRMQEFYK